MLVNEIYAVFNSYNINICMYMCVAYDLAVSFCFIDRVLVTDVVDR